MGEFSSKKINEIDDIYQSIYSCNNTELDEQQSDVSKQWEKGAKWFMKASDKYFANPVSGAMRAVADYGGSAASGVTKALTGGSVDLEKIGADAERVLGSGGGKPSTKALTVKSEPEKPKPSNPSVGRSGGLKLEGWGPFLTQKEKDEINTRMRNNSKPRIAAPRGQELGTQEPGKPSTWKPSTDPELLKRYKDRRGAAQLAKDKEAQSQASKDTAAKERRNAIRQAQIDAEKERLKSVGNPPEAAQPPAAQPPAARPPAQPPAAKPPAQPPAAKPPAAKPAPSPAPKIEKSPSGYAVGTAPGGVKFERRAATRAELDAAQAARKAAQEAGKSKAEVEKSAISAGVSASKKPVKEQTMENDAYDLVLEYLFSQGHVDTVEEAHYVMLEMDSEFIQDIVSESGYFPTPESQRADEAKYRKMRNSTPPSAKVKGRFIPGDDRMPGQPARPTTIPGK